MGLGKLTDHRYYGGEAMKQNPVAIMQTTLSEFTSYLVLKPNCAYLIVHTFTAIAACWINYRIMWCVTQVAS